MTTLHELRKTLKEQRDLPPIAARYIGEHSVKLRAGDGPHRDAQGKPLESLLIERGQTLMMHPVQVIGQTYLHDPRGELPSRWLGAGRVVLPEHPEHAQMNDQELDALGYEFHEGRPDFEPVEFGPDGLPLSSSSTSAPVADEDGGREGGSGRGRGKRGE